MTIRSSRFHRSRHRKPLMFPQHAKEPPREEELEILQLSSHRRRHSLHEYTGLSSNRLYLPVRSITSPPNSKRLRNISKTSIVYDIEWKEGPLGVTLHREGNNTVVKATIHVMVAVGDQLVGINQRSTADMDYLDVMLAVRQVLKPAILTFLRGFSEQTAQAGLNDINAMCKKPPMPTPLSPMNGMAEKSSISSPLKNLVENDEMYQKLAQLLAQHEVSESTVECFDREGTHLSQLTPASTIIACCRCGTCSSASIRRAAKTCLYATFSEVDLQNIESFDSENNNAAPVATQFQRHEETRRYVPTVTRIQKVKDAGTMTMCTEVQTVATIPTAPILYMDEPIQKSQRTLSTTIPLAIPVASSPQSSTKVTDIKDSHQSLDEATSPPAFGLGNFINHVFNNLTAPNKLKTHNERVMESFTRLKQEPHTASRIPKKSTYVVTWTSGALGLVLKNIREGVYIAEVTDAANITSNDFEVDDKLVNIHDMRVREIGYHDAVKLLQSITKPVNLTFQRRNKDS